MRMPDRGTEAVVKEEVAPRSCTVTTPDGTVHRNRRDLIQVSDGQDTSRSSSGDDEDITERETIRRSSQVSRPLQRLDPRWT